jgi:branched-subunit amino acid aminotransferase/4-amino-4-deoxychorismate lyase
MDKVFLNDKILAADKAALSFTDNSYLYGMGLFETMRAAGGRVFRLDDHISRMIASAKALSIPFGYTPAEITSAITQVLQANELTDARMRMTLSNGPLTDPDNHKGTLLITATRFTPYPDEYYQKGTRVALTEFRQNPNDPTCGHKTTSYAARLIALRNAHEKLAAESLWFTPDNYLAEGSISNVFIVKEGILQTPRLETPVLPGIARRTVIELAEKLGIPFAEKDLTIHDLLSAQEVFLTNVIMTILPITAIESHTVAEGKVGAMTKKLTEAYQQRLGK